ncbi:beta-1,3-galactosyltransferase 1-like [Physella acuta]|uniref:beta-1,3-galactosyltransferase 1-like n=1 Tax=Physella acuta TaxID=109671 RepID=UPI0027DD2B6F|nr:beta-1,3-galactosyltransferase 1-like [Physella acuta]
MMSPKKRATIQCAIVGMFFLSVFANVFILLTTRMKDKMEDYDGYDYHETNEDTGKDLKLSVLSAALTGKENASRKDFIKSLAACIRDKMKKLETEKEKLTILSLPNNINNNFENNFIIDSDVIRSMNWTLKREYIQQKSVFKLLTRPVITTHDYSYIHNPKDECIRRKIDVVLAVPSAPDNFEFRMKTREGLKGSYSHERSNNATLLFFLGRSDHHNKSRRFQVQINMEMRRFGDIVQDNFIDAYKNLTLKTVSVLKWVSTFCSRAKYVIKSDDDVGIKVAIAINALQRYRKNYGNFILGRWNTMNIVQRNPAVKNYVSPDEYKPATFPPHVLGGAMGFPVTTAKLLYEAALRIPRVWLDDVFLSGICAPLVNVPVFMDADFDFKHRQWT